MRSEPPDPIADPPGTEPVADKSESVSISVRDLADGTAVPGLAFHVARESDGAPLDGSGFVADAAGRVVVPIALLHSISPEQPFERAIAQTRDDICRAAELWVFRRIKLNVTAHHETELAAPSSGAGTIESWVFAGSPGVNPSLAEAPWNVKWLRGRRLHGRIEQHAASGTWPLQITAPRVRGLGVVVRIPGMRPAVRRVVVDSRTESADVYIDVSRPTKITGRLVESAGAPVAGASVVAYLEHRLAPSELDIELYTISGSAVTWNWDPTMTHGRLTLVSGASTGAEGEFTIEIGASGNTVVEARVDGRRPVRSPVFLAEGSVSVAPLHVGTAVTPHQIVLMSDAEPVAGARVTVIDVSSEIGQQLAISGRTDTSGRIDATALEPGRQYYFDISWKRRHVLTPDASGYIVWSQQEQIDIDRDLRPARR